MQNIIIATIKEWNIKNYFKIKELYKYKYNFFLISSNEELTKEYIDKINPKYIFFPHWSNIIKKEIYLSFNCVVFHMTDLPYGRGGSPLQNLLIRGIYDTKISAIKVEHGIDTGNIYIKKDLNISKGNATDIFNKISKIIFETMIPKILNNNIIPKKQTGKVVTFKRRMEEQSNITTLKNKSINNMYDFIRMLDADGYPNAYIQLDNIKVLLSNVEINNNKLIGRFEINYE